jgi:hypothetical protein
MKWVITACQVHVSQTLTPGGVGVIWCEQGKKGNHCFDCSLVAIIKEDKKPNSHKMSTVVSDAAKRPIETDASLRVENEQTDSGGPAVTATTAANRNDVQTSEIADLRRQNEILRSDVISHPDAVIAKLDKLPHCGAARPPQPQQRTRGHAAVLPPPARILVMYNNPLVRSPVPPPTAVFTAAAAPSAVAAPPLPSDSLPLFGGALATAVAASESAESAPRSMAVPHQAGASPSAASRISWKPRHALSLALPAAEVNHSRGALGTKAAAVAGRAAAPAANEACQCARRIPRSASKLCAAWTGRRSRVPRRGRRGRV